jgi:hypothetical protein
MAYMGGTTKQSGWALFFFLAGFAVLGIAAAGGGFVSFLVGIALVCVSLGIFKAARIEEEA